MIEVDAENVLSYLESRQTELADWPEFGNEELAQAVAAELAWGVSNIVLRVDTPARSFVVKQSRKQLRTPIDWFSQLERVWREVDTMRALETLLPAGAVPGVLFQDRENYLFAMEAVEADHKVWKAELLEGRFDSEIAARLGVLLRQSIGTRQAVLSWSSRSATSRFLMNFASIRFTGTWRRRPRMRHWPVRCGR